MHASTSATTVILRPRDTFRGFPKPADVRRPGMASFLAAVLLVLTTAVKGQDLRPLAVEDALRIRSFFKVPPSFSPDGKRLAYTVIDNRVPARIGAETGVTRMLPTDIYVSNTETGSTRNLTLARGNNWLPAWSPDGQYLAFFSSLGGKRQLKVWNAKNDSFRVLAPNLEVKGDQVEWSPDGRCIAVTTVPQELTGKDGAAITERVPQPPEEYKTPGSTVILYKSTDPSVASSTPWSLQGKRADLVIVDIASDRIERILSGERISRFLFSPDGSAIAYTDAVEFEKAGSQQILFDLVTVGFATKERRVVALNIRLDFDGAQFGWSPDGHRLAYQTGGVLETRNDCYVVDVDTGAARNATELPQHDPLSRTAAPLWSANGKTIYFIREGAVWQAATNAGRARELARIPGHRVVDLIRQSPGKLWTSPDERSTIAVAYDERAKQDGLYSIDLTSGVPNKLLEQGQCYTCAMRNQHVTAAPDGLHFAFFAEDIGHDTDLWLSDTSFAQSRRIIHLNPQFDSYRMGSAVLLNWLSEDGDPLQGAVLFPSDYRKDQRYPVVVWTYGGATLSDTLNHFGLAYNGPLNMQLLATRGYVVLLPDVPMQGNEPMPSHAKAVLPALNKLIEMGIADPSRIGVMGHSYGGYGTMALIVQTYRFAAAVEVDGFASLMGVYGEMDKTGSAFGMSIQERVVGGTPWQLRDKYIENSPIFYLDSLVTPLLIVQGADDENVAPFLADEIFVAARRLGKEVEYAKYAGEGHSPIQWTYANQLDFCNRMLNWFERYLKPGSRPQPS